jgi:hypothetical protein
LSCTPARRRIIIVTTVLVCLAIADVWMRRAEPVLRAYDVALYDKTVNELLCRGVPDIVLMGSSRAKYALMPAELEAATGKTAYNVAIPGSKVVEWQLLARRFFAGQRPQLVVLGINASELRADYLPTMAARHLFTLDDLREHLTRDRPSLEVIGNYLRHTLSPAWAAFHRRYELKMWCQERLESVLPKYAQEARELRERAAKPSPPGGYDHPWLRGRQLRTLEDQLTTDEARIVRASTPLFSPAADAFTRLGDLLDWFRRQRIGVIVVYIPNSPETESRWREVEPAMIETIEGICRSRDVPFLPCSQNHIPRSNRDFIEEIHVGLPLARQISDRIARHICALGLLHPKTQQLADTQELEGAAP